MLFNEHELCVALGVEGLRHNEFEEPAVSRLRWMLAEYGEPHVTPSETPATVPAGWKLVPVELTEPMRIAGYLYKDKLGAQALYRALLAAAPEAAK